MISKFQYFSVNYFLTRALFLGIGFSLITGVTKQDSIFAFVVGTIIGIFFIWMINKIQQYKSKKTLDEVLKEMKGLGIFLRVLLIIFGLVLLTEGLTFFQVFASFFLVRTPLYFISLPLILLILKISHDGINTTFRVASCLFPISFLLTILSQTCLFGYSDLNNIMPLFVNKPLTIMRSIFYYTSLSVSPYLLMLMTKNNNKNAIPAYLVGSLTLIFKMFLILAIIGPVLANLYRYPEYVILKEIKILDFIEKIENIVALSWVFDHFVYIAIASLFIQELLPQKKQKLWHTILVIISYFIAVYFIGKYYTNELTMYYTIPIFAFLIFIIAVPILFIFLLKKTRHNPTS